VSKAGLSKAPLKWKNCRDCRLYRRYYTIHDHRGDEILLDDDKEWNVLEDGVEEVDASPHLVVRCGGEWTVHYDGFIYTIGQIRKL